jgi:hypothetical protein
MVNKRRQSETVSPMESFATTIVARDLSNSMSVEDHLLQNSVFLSKTLEFTMAVLPSALRDLNMSIEDGIANFLLRYSKAIGGVLFCFDNVRILDGGKGNIINEFPHIHYRVVADGVVFAPAPGSNLQGVVKASFHSHLLLSVFRSFSASIQSSHLQAAGYHFDGESEEWRDKDGNLAFLSKEEFYFDCVTVHESDGIISIEGSNLSDQPPLSK